MLMNSVKRYIALRRQLGYGLLQADRLLTAYAQFAKCQGDTHIRVSTAVAWATAASTPGTRYVRLNAVVLLLVSCTQKMQRMKSLRPTYFHLHRAD